MVETLIEIDIKIHYYSHLNKNVQNIFVKLNKSALRVCCRDFLEHHYVNLKKSNPEFPILIRECSGVQARVWARYGGSAQPGFASRSKPAEAGFIAVASQLGPTGNLENHPLSSSAANDVAAVCVCRVWEGEKCFSGQHVS